MLTVPAMPTKPRLQRSRSMDPADEANARAGEVGRRISYNRTAAGLSQQQLAAMLGGVDPRTLKNWERGSTTASKPTQTLVTELEHAEGGAVTQGRGLNALYVGPSCEVLYQIEQVLEVHEGTLTTGIYHGKAAEEPLESRILRDSTLTKPEKDSLLGSLAAFRSLRR